ncbi:MAG: hypothetical protein V4590_09820 [Bacteroidota bacterium]
MHTTSLRITILVFILVLACAGCGQRYWYRLKLDGSSVKRYSVKVDVVNHTPKLISDDFETILKKGALKELKKNGYYETPKDSPDYFLVLQLAVDSFNMALYQQQTKIAMYSDSTVKAPNTYRFKKTVRAILMQCDLVQRKPLKRKWTGYEDIYYFNDYWRDVGRSEGVIRYLIRSAEEKSKIN